MSLRAELEADLAQRRAEGLHRAPRRLEGYDGAGAWTADGRRVLVFCSNDYLGLGADPRPARAMAEAAERCGLGSGAAHLVSGHRPEHEALEAELAALTGRPRALLFSTGYMANLGVVTALAGRGDALFEDRLNHASLLDAARLSGARVHRYRHADAGHLAARLAAARGRPRLVVTDGLFSMDGDLAPLPELAAAAARAGAHLVVDDAHGLGVVGEGAGSIAATGCPPEGVAALVGTLGKGFGAFGAFVAGDEALIETLVQRARTYIYTTAPPPALAAATLEAVRIARREGWRRERLAALVARFRAAAADAGLPPPASASPIQPVVVGDSDRALRVSARLEEAGFLVTAIRPPTVPAGSARLRVTLSAAHRGEDVDRLVEALARALRAEPGEAGDGG